MSRILIVEDQLDLARALRRVLRSRGHEVVVVSACRDALAIVEPVDCAILDIDLPDGNGVELAESLSVEGRCRAIVFFSARTEEAIQRAARQWGPFISKSADVTELVNAVERSLQLARNLALAGSGTFPSAGKSQQQRKYK